MVSLNSSFFHNSAQINKHNNSIFQIIDQQGIIHSSSEGIEEVFLNHCSILWSKNSDFTFPNLIRALPPDLPFISTEDATLLIRPISKDEVYKNLTS